MNTVALMVMSTRVPLSERGLLSNKLGAVRSMGLLLKLLGELEATEWRSLTTWSKGSNLVILSELAVYEKKTTSCSGVPPRLVLITLLLLGDAPKADLVLLLLVMDPEFHKGLS